MILEAAASGLPVVAAAAGGALELVGHRATGLLVPPDDPAAFAEALAELVDDAPFRLSLGRRALAGAQRRSWAGSYEELRQGYASVLPHGASCGRGSLLDLRRTMPRMSQVFVPGFGALPVVLPAGALSRLARPRAAVLSPGGLVPRARPRAPPVARPARRRR